MTIFLFLYQALQSADPDYTGRLDHNWVASKSLFAYFFRYRLSIICSIHWTTLGSVTHDTRQSYLCQIITFFVRKFCLTQVLSEKLFYKVLGFTVQSCSSCTLNIVASWPEPACWFPRSSARSGLQP